MRQCVSRVLPSKASLDLLTPARAHSRSQKLCRFRFLTCLACGEQYRAGFRNEHLDVCSGAIVVCPHGGRDCLGPRDSGTYARRDANKHANELCPNKPFVLSQWCLPCEPPG